MDEPFLTAATFFLVPAAPLMEATVARVLDLVARAALWVEMPLSAIVTPALVAMVLLLGLRRVARAVDFFLVVLSANVSALA